MFRSIITTAVRNLLRNKSFSFINLAGLSISMSLCMLIINIVKEQYAFDNFHADADRIFRVNTRAMRVSGGHEDYASTPLPLGAALRDGYTLIEDVVRIRSNFHGDATHGTVNVPVSGLTVDPSFFQVFNFSLTEGDVTSALHEPHHVVLTTETAKRLFGNDGALGKTITVSGYGDFTVAGVLAPFPSKTHFEFELLTSFTALPGWEQSGIASNALENWNNYYSGYLYFKIQPNRTAAEVESALADIYKHHYANLKLETRDKGYQFYLQPLEAITPGPELSNQMGKGMPTVLLIFLTVLAGIVLLMSIFNFTNLMIAKSLSRAREIGVRKVVGAQRYHVFLQFVGETVVFALVALLLSYLLFQFLKIGYLQLPLNEDFAMDLHEDVTLVFLFIGFSLAVGLLAGLLPASYLSAFRPARVLKDAGNVKIYSRLTFRKMLMVAQFTLSVIFVIVILIINKQIDFMLNADYGFNDKDIVNVRLQGNSFDPLATEVSAIPGVLSVGRVSHRLGTWQDRASDYKRMREDEPFVVRDFVVDASYLSNLELEFLAGRNFSEGEERGNQKYAILNETALARFNFANPLAAVGQSIIADDSLTLQVVGVVRDFHFRPFTNAIGPLVLRCGTEKVDYLSARIDITRKASVLAAINTAWKKIDAVHQPDVMIMADEIDDAYRQAGMHDLRLIVGYIAFLAVTVACLGMLGMAMYATQTRVKEVGVRKVMGASVGNVVALLSRSFLWLIALAVILGTPVSYLLGTQFLQLYAYQTTITIGTVLGGIGIITLLGTLAIASQTVMTASANPVKALRYEYRVGAILGYTFRDRLRICKIKV